MVEAVANADDPTPMVRQIDVRYAFGVSKGGRNGAGRSWFIDSRIKDADEGLLILIGGPPPMSFGVCQRVSCDNLPRRRRG